LSGNKTHTINVGPITKKLLNQTTGAIVEELANVQETLIKAQEELEFVRDKASNMSQEIIAVEEAARVNQIGLMEAQQENEQFQLEVERQLAYSNGQVLAAQQESDQLRMENDRLRRAVEELQAKVGEASGDGMVEVSLREGRG
jgi:hypothetical protein